MTPGWSRPGAFVGPQGGGLRGKKGERREDMRSERPVGSRSYVAREVMHSYSERGGKPLEGNEQEIVMIGISL